jgi:RimJ/RimL family protein N-acetyltransferase
VSWEGAPAPYRIETERLVIRCYEPADAPLLTEALNSSIEHLRPFMPWADDLPQSVEDSYALCRRFRAAFDSDEQYVCGFFESADRRLLGGGGLHPRTGPGGMDIGYWVRASSARQGIAAEAAAALTRVGIEVCNADRIEIHVDPGNEASLGVPRKLGFTEEATLRRRLPGRAGGPLRDVTIFTMFREDFDPAIAPDLRAFDALGRQLV